jgi:hypothetical protein
MICSYPNETILVLAGMIDYRTRQAIAYGEISQTNYLGGCRILENEKEKE